MSLDDRSPSASTSSMYLATSCPSRLAQRKGREGRGGEGHRPTHPDAVLLEALGAGHLAVHCQTEGLTLGPPDGGLPLLPDLGAVLLLGHLAAARTAQQPVTVLGRFAVDGDGEAAVAGGTESDLPGSRRGLRVPVGIGVVIVVVVVGRVGVAVRATPFAFLAVGFSLSGCLALALGLALGFALGLCCSCGCCWVGNSTAASTTTKSSDTATATGFLTPPGRDLGSLGPTKFGSLGTSKGTTANGCRIDAAFLEPSSVTTRKAGEEGTALPAGTR